MHCYLVKTLVWAASTTAMLGVCAGSDGESIEELRLDVPVYSEVKTHVHRPADLTPGEKLPAVLFVGGNCELTTKMLATLRIVCIHFSPKENIPEKFRAWEPAFGHAGQDAIALLLSHQLEMPEVDKHNVGIVTLSFGVVGATGALARHPDLSVKYLIDWEGPSGPQNMKWVLPTFPAASLYPPSNTEFWGERTASEFIKRIKCRYLRIQAETDHVQVLGKNQHAIEMLNNATRNGCPWTRCNDNQPNVLYDEERPESEKGKWLPGALSLEQTLELITKYVREMSNMPALPTEDKRR